jgi:hypothetical protein
MPGGFKQITPADSRPFVKGDVRINRLGTPKKLNLDKLLRKVLMQRINNQSAIKGILIKLRDMALSGDLRAMELLLDRTFGKPKTTIETTGKLAVIGITYVIPGENGNEDSIKADPEAARVSGGSEDK